MSKYDRFVQICESIADERRRQDTQWGPDHDDQHQPADWANIIQSRPIGLGLSPNSHYARKRVLRMAAVAVAAIEAIDRRNA